MATRQAGSGICVQVARSGPLILLTATKDVDHNQAAVLIQYLHSAQ